MTMTANKLEAIKDQANALANEQIMVATNQGTYAGNPQFDNVDVYERVGDKPLSQKTIAAKFDGAAGYMRLINQQAMAAKRAELTSLRKQIADATR